MAGSNEAMEGSLIIIDDGDIELHSADDGVNAATSDDSTSTDGQGGSGRHGRRHGGRWLGPPLVNGGALEVWSSGDGLDSNGLATITGGDIVVYGPYRRRQRRPGRQQHLRRHRRHPHGHRQRG